MFMNLDGYFNFVDLKDNPVERTKEIFPYSYDPFVIWKKGYKESDNAVYSDRLHQWDWEKYNRCHKEVWGNEGQYFYENTPKEIEKFLRLYFNEDIVLTAVMEGCNYSNGYPYWVFYYRN